MRRSRTFPPSQPPDEEGVYERKYPTCGWRFCRWRNGKWSAGYHNPEFAALCTVDSGLQNLPWRGLARKPT